MPEKNWFRPKPQSASIITKKKMTWWLLDELCYNTTSSAHPFSESPRNDGECARRYNGPEHISDWFPVGVRIFVPECQHFQTFATNDLTA
jgi:hypothetical protein